jgi:hypothetical protein
VLDAIARNLELLTEGLYEQGARRRAEQDDEEEEPRWWRRSAPRTLAACQRQALLAVYGAFKARSSRRRRSER